MRCCYHDIMIRTQVSLTEEQLGRLRELARTRNVSIAELIRRAVDGLFVTADMDSRRRRALEVIGEFAGDGSPVSEEHDRYLADAYAEL